jgi:HPt (histidine-containing phosphotransfer) domain-containing protein
MRGRSLFSFLVPARVKSHFAHAFSRVHKKSPPAGTQDGHASAAEVPVLDLGVFNELHATLGGSAERVCNVYAKFQDSTTQRIDELRQQPAALSVKTLHALKGSAGMVGASRLAALAARLHEATVESGTLPAGAVAEIEAGLAKFRETLRGQLARL